MLKDRDFAEKPIVGFCNFIASVYVSELCLCIQVYSSRYVVLHLLKNISLIQSLTMKN